MKKTTIILLVNILIVSSFGQKAKYVKSAEDSLAYAIGVGMYEGIKTLDIDLDLDILARGMQAAKKESTIFTSEEANLFVREYLTKVEEERMAEIKAEGIEFLKVNGAKEVVKVTESGLQYEVVEMGTGSVPTAEDQVKVHYTGFLLDGTKFDSSVDRGEPSVFGVGQVIKGWTEVLQLMPVGSKFKVYIPSDLAYGDRGAGEDIKPGSVLIFDIELIDIMTN